MNHRFIIALFMSAMLLLPAARGADPLRLTRDEFIDSLPAWSPDGKQISFVSKRGPQYCLALIPPSGGSAIIIAGNAAKRGGYAWSSDAKQIAYVAKAEDGNEIHVVDISTAETKTIAKGENPAFSPDNRRLAFSNDKDVLVYDLQSGKTQNLTAEKNAAAFDALAWDSRARLIYFARDGNLWKVSATAGKDQILLFDHLAGSPVAPTVGKLAVLPGGKAILASLITDGLYAHATDNILALYDVETQRMQTMIDANAWSLAGDGTCVFLAVGGSIYRFDLAARKKELLCSGSAPAISPDGKALVYLHKEKPLDENDLWLRPIINAK